MHALKRKSPTGVPFLNPPFPPVSHQNEKAHTPRALEMRRRKQADCLSFLKERKKEVQVLTFPE